MINQKNPLSWSEKNDLEKKAFFCLCNKLKVFDIIITKTQTEKLPKSMKLFFQFQIENMKKNSDETEEDWWKNGTLIRKRKRKFDFDVFRPSLQWFRAERIKNALINSAMITQKAEETGKDFENCEHFAASKRGLHGWQQKNNLVFKSFKTLQNIWHF